VPVVLTVAVPVVLTVAAGGSARWRRPCAAPGGSARPPPLL